ncbi:MAG: mechanosensitive ion channel family protein [Candidatus Marinimicrobia bacterium]|nr:mechanosensitive ion channel family protein [Candidatus Neomarinimicrobiota bacterium]
MIETLILYTKQWIPTVSIIFTGVLLGYFFKRIIHKRLVKLASKTEWRGDDIVFQSLKSHIVLWFSLAAFYVASDGIQLGDPYTEYLAKLVQIVLILSVTLVLSKILVGMLQIWSDSQEGGFPSTELFTNLIRIVIIIIGVLIALESLNLSIAPFLTALGVGGLAISLALKDTLSDFFSGLHILLSKKVAPGDFVELDTGEMGYVENITWRNTSMKERSNNIISIPNSRLSTAIVRNFNSIDSEFRVNVDVGISYDSDLEHVRKVTLEVANQVVEDNPGAVKTWVPQMRYFMFGDSSINFRVLFRVKKYGEQHELIDTFIRRLHKRFNAEGIEIPFPIRTIIHKKDGE